MNIYQIYAAGQFITTSQTLAINNPFDNSLVATTFLANKEILEQVIVATLIASSELKKTSALQKQAILGQISNDIIKNKNYLAEILCKESAKPIKYALAEIERSAYTFKIAAEECNKIPTELLSFDEAPNGKGKTGVVNHFPIGLVAGISPFNFPLNLAVHKIAPAIASGCPIILKPSSLTPLSCLELAKIINNTDLPEGAVSILPMNRETGNILVTDERIKLLSFTGSPEVGWNMKQHCGKKKIVLELGGNAATIITESANLNDAVAKSVFGAFAYSGQICIHAQRFIVHTALYQTFIDALKVETQKLNYGNPIDTNTDVSNLIDEQNAIRIESWINEALKLGAQVICGGKRIGSFIEPTILINCNKTMKIYAEEVFGPVICINSFDSIHEGIQLANDTKYGLQCGVFTNSDDELTTCFNHIDVGGIIHNNVPTLRFDNMPYGGIKESGLGREGVKYAMHDMTELKILVK